MQLWFKIKLFYAKVKGLSELKLLAGYEKNPSTFSNLRKFYYVMPCFIGYFKETRPFM